MGYKINGEVIISNSKDIDNVGIATMDLVDAKVSAKAITEQTEGAVSDVTGADEVLIYDAEGGALLRVTVDEFISGSGIGTLVTEFDSLSVTGIITAAKILSGDLGARNLITVGIATIQDHLEVNDSTGSGSEYNLNVKTSGSSTFGVLGNGAILLGNSSAAPFMATNDHHATSKKFVDDAIGLSTVGLASTEYVDQAVASAGGEWTLTGTNLAPNSSSTNVVVDSSIGIGTTATSGARVTVVNEMFENLSYLPVVTVRQNDIGEENNIQEWIFYNDHPLRLYSESSNDYNLGLVQFGGDDPTAKSYMKFHGDGFSGITFHAGTTNGSASQVFSMNAFGQVRDKIGSIRGFGSPITKSSDYTPDSGDEGYLIEFTSGNATVSYDGGFNEGCGFHIVNNSSSSMSIIQGAGNTMYFTEDGTTGNRTLGARGLARVFYMDSSWWIDGSGLS